MTKFTDELKEAIAKLDFLHSNFEENDLIQFFVSNKGRIISKWIHYFEIYDRYFNQFRDKEINVLEVGVNRGGSLEMWRKYFGTKANIFLGLIF